MNGQTQQALEIVQQDQNLSADQKFKFESISNNLVQTAMVNSTVLSLINQCCILLCAGYFEPAK